MLLSVVVCTERLTALDGRQVLSVGSGTWDGTITNPNNPQRRDVQIVPASGYAVRPSLSTPFSHPFRPLTHMCTH